MNFRIEEPQCVAIAGVSDKALVRVRGDTAEVAIAVGDLATRRRLKGTTIEMMDAKWLVTEASTSAALVSFACRRTSSG